MQKSGEKSEKNGQMLSLETLENDLKAKLNLLPKVNCDVVSSDLCELSREPAKSDPIDIPILTPAMLESSSYSSVLTSAVVGSFLDKSDKFSEPNNVSFPLVSVLQFYSVSNRAFFPTFFLIKNIF